MNRSCLTATLLGIVALSSTSVNAAAGGPAAGPYLGAALGRTSFSAGDLGLPRTGSDEVAVAGKLYGGWQIDPRFGVEAGYVRLGALSETLDVAGTDLRQGAKARSLYVAATGRLPVGEAVALTGKAGVSFGRVSGSSVLPASADLTGSRRSFMFGVGAEYSLSPQVALTADFDHLGKVSDKVRANLVSVGMRYRF